MQVRRWLVVATLAAAAAAHAAATSETSFDSARVAWQRGDYVTALNGYIRVLNAPDGDAHLQQVARATGEWFRTSELTADGRAGRFSPDGRYIAYESGLETSRRTLILNNDDRRDPVAELPGVGAAFSTDGSSVAYLRIEQTDDVRRAAAALDAASLTASNRSFLVQTLAWLIARDSRLMVHDLASGHEVELPTPPAFLKTGLTYASDGRTVLFLGARENDETRTDIYSIAEGAFGPSLVVDAGGLKTAPVLDASGRAILYQIPNVSPLRRPPAPGTAPAAAGRPRTPSSFGIVDLATGRVTVVTGVAPTLSADGRTLAYIARDEGEYQLMVGPTLGLQAPLRRGPMRMDAPALSADGRRVAWQMMPRDDWEIFVADIDDARGERRVTREIQHDVLPRFLGPNRLIAMVGEPRHRRAYLYDLTAAEPAVSGSAGAIRLFDNNTVRTIAPEYEWAASLDGTKVLVGAERDGDTVSPARGVYLVDLARTVTRTEVLERLRRSLRSEMALKATATRTFAPLAEEVRRIVGRASVDRIFGYEKTLFDFDSKNISKPGNHLASEFLFETYKSFGYQPEYQWFEPARRDGSTAPPVKTANVVATLRGTVNPELVYVISSHYDSVEAGPGADDDSSGTAALLEAARILADHPLPATVVFASMTGEEANLLGSREFVRRASELKWHVAGVLNNDMIGWMNDERMDNTIRYSNPGIRDIQHGAAMLFTRLITYDAQYWKGTDAMSFYDVYGDVIGGIGSYPVLGSPYYHQASDLLEHENHQLIAETSKATVATIMLLASSPSRLTHLRIDSYTGGAASLSWTPSPEKGVTAYVVAWGPPGSPLQHRLRVVGPKAIVPGVAPGTVVSVKAVDARGLEGWDWAHVTVPRGKAPAPTHTQGGLR